MVPKGKIQITNPKSQANTKHQITNFKSQASTNFSNQKETTNLWNLLGA
jgi:hypothetical protein